VKEIGLQDVIPELKIDENKKQRLFCVNCSFKGWVDEYNQEANGIIQLFKPGEKHGCIKKNNKEDH